MNNDDMEATACCNVIIWDMFLVTITLSITLIKSTNINWLLCIFIGVIASAILVALMLVKIMEKIIQLIFSIIWGLELTPHIAKLFKIYDTLETNPVYMWIAKIMVILLFFGLHLLFSFLFTESIGGIETNTTSPKKTYKNRKKYNKLNQEFAMLYVIKKEKALTAERINTFLNNPNVNDKKLHSIIEIYKEIDLYHNLFAIIYEKFSSHPPKRRKQISELILKLQKYKSIISNDITTINDKLDELENEVEQNKDNSYSECEDNDDEQNTSSEGNNYINKNIDIFFAGCNDLSSLKIRYRNLMKLYHPDSSNVDDTVCKLINDEYEKLCKSMCEHTIN